MSKKKSVDVDQQSVIAHFEQQITDLTDALQRERADSTNIRRQHDAQIGSLRTIVKVNLIRDLLPVIDSLERSLKHVPEDIKDHEYIKGIQGVVKQFEKTLQDAGVEKIKTVGEEFDPKFHEAVSMDEGDGTAEVVSEELQSGYAFGDDVIRHAMVRVKMDSLQIMEGEPEG